MELDLWYEIEDLTNLIGTFHDLGNYVQECANGSSVTSIEDIQFLATFADACRKLKEHSIHLAEKAIDLVDCETDTKREHQIIHDQNHKALLKSTCEWVFSNPMYQKWFETQGSFLWIHVGTGKTMLMSAIIDKLIIEFRQNPAICAAYFYCHKDSGDLCQPLYILRSIAKQIWRKAVVQRGRDFRDDHIAKTFTVIWKSSQIRSNHRNAYDYQYRLQKCIEDMAEYYEDVFICVDGVDHCNTATSYTKRTDVFLEVLRRLGGGNIHVLVSSRHTDMAGSGDGNPTLPIQKFVQEDIVKYVNWRVSQFLHFKSMEPSFINDLKKYVIEESKGMFMWAHYVLCELDLRAGNPQSVFKPYSTDDCPRRLGEIYAKTFEINSRYDHWEWQQLVLKWLVFGPPLTLEQLKFALKIELGDRSPFGRCDYDLIQRFESLIKVNEETCHLEFCHPSVSAYLKQWFWYDHVNPFFLDETEAQRMMDRCIEKAAAEDDNIGY